MEQILFNPYANFQAGYERGSERKAQNILGQYGAAAMQGDKNALNALASNPRTFDVAQGIMGRQQDQAYRQEQLGMDRERLNMAKEQARAAAAREAAAMDRAEAEAEAAQLREVGQIIGQAVQSGDQRLLDMASSRWAALGGDPAGISLDMAPGILATIDGALQGTMEAIGGQQPADEYQRYVREEQSAGRQPLSRLDYAQAKKGQETVYGPDGNPILYKGPAGEAPKKLTENQSKFVLFGGMMDATMPVINGLETRFDPANIPDNLASRAGTVGNFFKSDEMQKYNAAAAAWAEGVLRLQTGAAATDPEIQRVVKTYFAQPGDSQATVQYKKQLREQYAQTIGLASGGLINPSSGAGEAKGADQPGTVPSVNLTGRDQELFDRYPAPTGE